MIEAEVGIRTVVVTALRTSASPVFYQFSGNAGDRCYFNGQPGSGFSYTPNCRLYGPLGNILFSTGVNADVDTFTQIGRASCRERVEISVVAVSLKKKRLVLIGRDLY